MPILIEMPKLSDTMTEGTLVRWKKKIGDKIEMGDVIAEIETDKATMEMEAFDDGILTEIYAKEGDRVALGQKIAMLLEPGETAGAEGAKPAAPAAPASAPAPAAKGTAEPAAVELPGAVATGAVRPAVTAAAAALGARVKASPLAKKLAAERGIDLNQITGSGPGGRIVEQDVLGAKPGAAPQPPSPKPTAAPAVLAPALVAVPATPAAAGDQRIPLTGMRRVIADKLLISKTTIPHFYLNIEVDADPLMQLRVQINAAAEAAGQGKITVNDLVIKAVIAALTKVPKVNAAWAGDAIIEYGAVNLAVAVAVEEGLVTPVIRDAAKKSLREISESIKDLATRARTKKLKPEEYQGGTFTVSNLGAYGIETFSAIINPPQAAILAVGAIVKKPVVNAAGQIVAGQRMSLGLSCDHRVVDGAIGAQFLGELRKLVENPTLMLL